MLNPLGKDRDSATPQREGVKCQILFPVLKELLRLKQLLLNQIVKVAHFVIAE
jgi:hypothetical protein